MLPRHEPQRKERAQEAGAQLHEHADGVGGAGALLAARVGAKAQPLGGAQHTDFHSFRHYVVWILEDILRLQDEVYGERVSFLTHKCAMELRLPDSQCSALPIPRAAAATYLLPHGDLL